MLTHPVSLVARNRYLNCLPMMRNFVFPRLLNASPGLRCERSSTAWSSSTRGVGWQCGCSSNEKAKAGGRLGPGHPPAERSNDLAHPADTELLWELSRELLLLLLLLLETIASSAVASSATQTAASTTTASASCFCCCNCCNCFFLILLLLKTASSDATFYCLEGPLN